MKKCLGRLIFKYARPCIAIALCLVLALALPLISGCGQKKQDEQSAPESIGTVLSVPTTPPAEETPAPSDAENKIDGLEKNQKESFSDTFGVIIGAENQNVNAVALKTDDGSIYVYSCEKLNGEPNECIFKSANDVEIQISRVENIDEQVSADMSLSNLELFKANGSAERPLNVAGAGAANGGAAKLYMRGKAENGFSPYITVEIADISNPDLASIDLEALSAALPGVIMADGKCVGIVADTEHPYIPEGGVLPAGSVSPSSTGLAPEPKNNDDVEDNNKLIYILLIAIILIALLLILAVIVKKRKDGEEEIIENSKHVAPQPSDPPQSRNVRPSAVVKRSEVVRTEKVAKVHDIGKRSSQQDSLGTAKLKCGLLAVVADGMGGLSGGDKVSQRIVMTMLKNGENLTAMRADNDLFPMTGAANTEINRMLGGAMGSSGSTLIAVFLSGNYFHWVSVGDSRIYLYTGGTLIQLNSEHNYESDLILDAINGKIPFSDVKTNSRRKGLTSFIGMGKLEHVDGSLYPVKAKKGDKILLMSDGVYNTLKVSEMENIIAKSRNVQEIADEFERRIKEYDRKGQDNFTSVIIEI